MCGIIFIKVDHIDCKIRVLEVKKRNFFIPYKTRLKNFESSLLKILHYTKFESFGILFGNWAKISIKKYINSRKPSYFLFKGLLSRRYMIKGKNEIANIANMELKIVNPNSDNVVVSNLNNINFYFFENCNNWVQQQTSYVSFWKKYHNCLKNRILHIIYLTNQHWVNQNFPNRYGSVP
jgi:hypothetical protein